MNLLLNNVVFYVLIIDDDTDDHYFLRKAINKVIPQAITESLFDGHQAMRYLESCDELPNLIFLDLKMTNLSGRATLELIRSNPTLCNIPVVILTNNEDSLLQERLFDLGANEFYVKPKDTRELVPIVEAMAGRYLDPVVCR